MDQDMSRAMDEKISPLIGYVRAVLQSGEDGQGLLQARQKDALETLSVLLQPTHIQAPERRLFIQRALETGIVATAADLVQFGSVPLATAACTFLGSFAFNSDAGARAALKVFDRISSRFASVLNPLTWEHMPLLEAAILLCVNIAATCPSGHPRLIPLVKPVCLQIIRNPRASQTLRGNTILLLANLSMTVSQELRSLGVADALLDLVLQKADASQNSVAESVIIFLHGDCKSGVMDKLMDINIVSDYCVPIMQLTLQGQEFRGMYPHLMYSARLFQVLSQCREYAELLARNEHVVPLLLKANQRQESPMRLESDLEGRRLSLEALSSLVGFGLWRPLDELGEEFVSKDLPLLLADEHVGIRASAATLWAQLHSKEVWTFYLLGVRLQCAAQLPPRLWKDKVLSFLLPYLAVDYGPYTMNH